MKRDVNNKVIVVTGGANGIGFAIVEELLKENAKNVVFIDINEAQGNEAASKLNDKYGQGKAEFIKGDVSKDLNEVSAKIFEKYKTVDCLVNNAGILDEYSPRKVLEVNAISQIEWTMKFLEHMRKDKSGNGGLIINIGSIYSYVVDQFTPVYKASKYAVLGFSKTLGHERNYQIYGVRVVVLCPGATVSTLSKTAVVREEESKEFYECVETYTTQPAEELGKAAVKVFETAESGTAWSVIDGVMELVP